MHLQDFRVKLAFISRPFGLPKLARSTAGSLLQIVEGYQELNLSLISGCCRLHPGRCDCLLSVGSVSSPTGQSRYCLDSEEAVLEARAMIFA